MIALTLIACLFILIASASDVRATNYYVSPFGNDTNDGLTPKTAWLRLDNGDGAGLVDHGDTINILPGRYIVSSGYELYTDGTAAEPIVYRRLGAGPATLDGDNIDKILILMEGNHTIIDGLELTDTRDNALHNKSDTCIVRNCYIHHTDKIGLRVEGVGNIFYNNIIAFTADDGIKNEGPGEYSTYYHNTVYGCGKDGIELKEKTARLFNNIFVLNENGIRGDVENICAHNNVWANTNSDYEGNVVDSAGGLSVDPLFVDGAGGDYSLQESSLLINAGLDVGYPFVGAAPDMGGIEYRPHTATNYYVAPDGDDTNDGLTPMTAWQTVDNGECLGYMGPGDTVNVLSGVYSLLAPVYLMTSGTAADPIVYRKHGKAAVLLNIDFIDDAALFVTGNHIVVSGLSIYMPTSDGAHLRGDSCLVQRCEVRTAGGDGIDVGGIDGAAAVGNIIYGNLVSACGGDGVEVDDAAEGTRVYNNTIVSCIYDGISCGAGIGDGRIVNNIVSGCDNGIAAPAAVVGACNNIWGSLSAAYAGGVTDSAGGLSVIPGFVNGATGRYNLKRTALEIDAGLDVGFPYNRGAPDMGAFEKFNVYFVAATGDDTNDGRDTTTAWATIHNGDSLLYPGDSVYVAAGTYAGGFVLTDDGLLDDRIVYMGVRDSSIIDANSVVEGIRLDCDFVEFNGFSVQQALENDLIINGGSNLVNYCRLTVSDENGLTIESGSQNQLQFTALARNAAGGVHIAASAGITTIANSTFFKNANGGIIDDAGGASFVNNIFVQNDSGAIIAPATSTVTYSIFDQNENDIIGGATAGSGCLYEDPLMIDPDAGQYRLSAGSPAINAGLDIGLPYAGIAPDMGAYEAKAAASLIVVESYDSLLADNAYQFTVEAFDAGGNPADPGTVTWSHTFASGSIDGTGLFSPQFIGDGEIIVESVSLGLTDTSVTMTVVPGEIVDLIITPNGAIVSSDSTLQFGVIGVDEKGNDVGDFGAISWSVTNAIGTIDNDGLFAPKRIGDGFVRVNTTISLAAITDTIYVIAGALTYLDVIPDDNTMRYLEDFQYQVLGYDSDSNLVKNYTDSAAWSTTDADGGITAGGLYTTGVTPGTYFITASYDGLDDSGAVLVSDELDHFRIEYADGTPVGDTTMPTDIDTTIIYARGYTAAEILLGDVAVQWSIDGDSIGHTVPEFGPITRLELTMPGTAAVIAIDTAAGMADTSGIIICEPGSPTSLVGSPDTLAIMIDSSAQFTAVSYDLDGNVSIPQVVSFWDLLDGIGTIDSVGLFTATAVGTGYMEVSGAGFFDTLGPISVLPGPLASIVIAPDSTLVSADSTRQFSVLGYDEYGNPTDAGAITWSLVDPLGSIDASGVFTAVTVGQTRVVAESSLGPVDTSAALLVTPGRLVSLTISPDSVEVSADNTVLFSAAGVDAEGNAAAVGGLTWSVDGTIGDITSDGLFTPQQVGSGRIIVVSSIDAVTDTNRSVVVTAGELAQIIISPNIVALPLDGTAVFTATGYDAKFNPADVGTITWDVLGRMGTIDAAGGFTGTRPGAGRITAASSVNGVTDTSTAVTVEALYLQTISLGTIIASPGQATVPVLAFRLDNYHSEAKTVTAVTVSDASSGAGNAAELWSNVDSASIYIDTDNDSTLTEADNLLATATYEAAATLFSFAPQTIQPDAGQTYFVGLHLSLNARDGDTLDVVLSPATDIVTGDGSVVDGPVSADSYGVVHIDGMVAAQVLLPTTGTATLSPGDVQVPVMAIDIPRNGYRADTLLMVSLVDNGTAGAADIQALTFYKDSGDDTWTSAVDEIALGNLVFTGSRWIISGLAVPVSAPSERFFLAATLTAYPADAATIAMSLPVDGLEMASANDGPIDAPVPATDTVVIQTSEAVTIDLVPLTSHTLIPGQTGSPIFACDITNGYAAALGLDSLLVDIPATNGDGQALFDSQLDSLLLYLNRDGDYAVIGAADTVLASAVVSGGVARFAMTGFSIAEHGGSVGLAIAPAVSLPFAKNGSSIGAVIADEAQVFFSQAVIVTADFPLENPAAFSVDAFPTAATTVYPVAGRTIFGGQSTQLVLDIGLPGNGYAADVLKRIDLINTGSASAADALAAVKLWADLDADGLGGSDVLLGTFAYGGGHWELTGLNHAVPATGARLLVTVDATNDQFTGGTLALILPVGGAEYASGMIGPDDDPVINSESHLLFPSNRITAISVPEGSSVVEPGRQDENILTFALYNGFIDQAQTLQSVTLKNISRSASDAAFADSEIGQVSLYYDDDANRILDDDLLLATGYFSGGLLKFDGVNVSLPAESLSYMFVTADIPYAVIDGDSLAVEIAGPSDLVFSEAVNINGDLPLTSGGYKIIDGSIGAQYQMAALESKSLSPGDTGVTMFALRPARNGNLVDLLQSLAVRNLLDADASDIAGLELWLDYDGDGIRQTGDSLLGTFTFGGGLWTVDNLALPVGQPEPLLFVVGDIDAAATPGRALQFEVPVDGCQFASANDGPRGSALTGDGVFTISASTLRVEHVALNPSYSVGQNIGVAVDVTNLSATPVTDVSAEVVGLSDSLLVSYDSSQAGPVTLAAGETTRFSFYYTAGTPGSVSWQLRALAASTGDTSATVTTSAVKIQSIPGEVTVALINSIPASVTKGQHNVFPLSITYAHPESSPTAAPLRLDSLRLRVTDGAGADQAANSVFSRIVLTAGFVILAVDESITSGADVVLPFAAPVIVAPNESQVFTLLVDIDSLATADEFMLSLDDASAIPLVDANTSQAVPFSPLQLFPMQTASCRIDEPSQHMAVDYDPVLANTANFGQDEVAALTLILRHPGGSETSQIQLTALSIAVVDSALNTIIPADLLSRMRLVRSNFIVAEISSFSASATPIEINLSSPVTLNPGETDSVTIQVWINETTGYPGFGMHIADSTAFQIRDLSSGSLLAAATDTLLLQTGSIFPITTGWARLLSPAAPPEVCLTSSLPASLIGGQDGLALLNIAIDYAVTADHAAIVLDNINVTVVDTLGRALDPDRLFDRIGYRLAGGAIQYQPFVYLDGGRAVFMLADDGLTAQPGESLNLELVGDVEADVPYDHFRLVIQDNWAFDLHDGNDSTYRPSVTLAAGCGGEFPYASPVTSIFVPAGRPLVSAADLPVQLVYAGQQGVTAFAADVGYHSETAQGDITVSSLGGILMRRETNYFGVAAPASLYERVTLMWNGEAIAVDSLFAGDAVTLTPETAPVISRGDELSVEILCDLRPDAAVANYCLQFDDSTCLVLNDKNLTTPVYPVLSGAVYPMRGVELSLAAESLENSFTNYPNPFNPARGEQTIIGYVLPEDADVDIEVFTITGELVSRVVSGEFRAAGAHQSDTWNGNNDRGREVIPGTYFCRITAQYASGRSESFKRKIAVLR